MRYIDKPITEERRKLAADHWSLAEAIARTMVQRYPFEVTADDLISYACQGLMAAARKFDPARKTKFSTYAKWCIEGAILDNVREDKNHYIISSKGARNIDDEDLHVSGSRKLTPEWQAEAESIKLIVRRAIEGLPEREREVVILYDIEDLTQKEIALRLGVSAALISIIRKRALKRLREKLEPLREYI
jgi:RNA polymerase sigma factor (sigma-70 family)